MLHCFPGYLGIATKKEWIQKQILCDESAIQLLFHIIIFSCKYKTPESIKVIAEGDTMHHGPHNLHKLAPVAVVAALQLPYPLISPNSGDWYKVNKCNICSSGWWLPSHNQPQSADLNPLIYIAENATIIVQNVRVDDVWIKLGWWKPVPAWLSWILSTWNSYK